MPKRVYELTVLYPVSDVTEDLKQAVVGVLAKCKIEVVKTDDWGEKPLAYALNKYNEGVFEYRVITGTPANLEKLRHELKLETRLLRWLLVSVS